MAEMLMINGKEYLTVSATKYYMRCTDSDMMKYIALGKLKTEKVKKREYVELESLQNLMTEMLARR
jgi:hypothetical protein